jgi:hypothetical protein
MRGWLLGLAACGHLGFGGVSAGDDATLGDAATMDATTDADAGMMTGRPNVAFVTSSLQVGNMGGLAGADATCNMLAAGVWPGTFVAFLGTTNLPPVNRLAGSRGWITTMGQPVYDLAADVAGERQIYPLDYDEHQVLIEEQVFSGANDAGGMVAGQTCNDWRDASTSASTGATFSTSGDALGFGTAPCSIKRRIYCFEIGQQFQVTAPAIPNGRIVFTSQQTWLPAGGLAGADMVCSSEAIAANLMGTYVALLATGSQGAITRVGNPQGPWRRADGVLLTSGALATGVFETAANRDAHGDPITGSNPLVWFGATDFTTAGTTNTCNVWTTQSSMTSISLLIDAVQQPQTRTTTCGTPQHLMCAEQ